MTDASPKSRKDLADHWTEIASAVLLAGATVTFTLQGISLHSGVGMQTFHLADSSIAGRKATELSIRADQQRVLDVRMFTNYVEAVIESKKDMAKFIIQTGRH